MKTLTFSLIVALLGGFSTLCRAVDNERMKYSPAEDVDTYPSPNHKFAITTATSKTPTHYKVQLVDFLTKQVLASYDPEARAIDAVWSPDSRFVAINEDLTHYANDLSVWYITSRKWRKVVLPERLQNEPIDRLLPKKDEALVALWWGAHRPNAERWIGPASLQIRIDGEAELKNHAHLVADYLVVVKCSKHCTCKIVAQKQLKCEIEPVSPDVH